MARKTTKKPARKPVRKPTRKQGPIAVKLTPEQLEKLTKEFAAQGVASIEIPSAPEGLLKMQRS